MEAQQNARRINADGIDVRQNLTQMGTRQRAGERDSAFARIDALMREAGIVIDQAQPVAYTIKAVSV